MRAGTLVFALRWIARLWSLASIGVLAAFAFGEPGVPTWKEAVALAFFPVGLVIGLIVGWWREGVGGVIGVGSMAAFYAWMIIASGGRVPSGPYFLILAAPTFVFLACGLVRQRMNRRPGAASGLASADGN